jgi:hypothetical protein
VRLSRAIWGRGSGGTRANSVLADASVLQVVVGRVVGRRRIVSTADLVLLGRPGAQVDLPASFRAKRSKAVFGCPADFLAACRAFDNGDHTFQQSSLMGLEHCRAEGSRAAAMAVRSEVPGKTHLKKPGYQRLQSVRWNGTSTSTALGRMSPSCTVKRTHSMYLLALASGMTRNSGATRICIN